MRYVNVKQEIDKAIAFKSSSHAKKKSDAMKRVMLKTGLY